jgi:PAS domain S-box-containing protein
MHENQWLIGSGEMANAIRNFNWSDTPLGPLHDWPPPLRFSVNNMLARPLPTIINWGKELTHLYNDAYKEIARDKHPQAFGVSALAPWPEISDTIRDPNSRVLDSGESIRVDNRRFQITRTSNELEDAWFTVTCSPLLLETGNPGGVLVTLTDCTELMESRDRLQVLAEHVPAAIAMFDREMRYIAASQRFITDHRLSESGLIGRSHYELFPELPERWKEAHQRCLAGATERCDEDPFQSADDMTQWVKWEMRPWQTHSGTIGGVLFFTEDVNTQRRKEQNLREAIDSREEFISVASHELKSPLTSLELQLDLLHRTLSSSTSHARKKSRILSKAAKSSARALSQLAGELLDLTRIRAGMLELQPSPMDLREAAAQVIERLARSAKEQGSTITLHGEEPVIGRWDPTRINQVLSNLVSNAIKFGNGKAIHVRISSDLAAGYVQISVQDHGIGIAPEMQENIFECFQQATPSHRIKGLGLGLYIVRQIVEAHGGSIRVESKLGQGSTFTVALPITAEGKS